MIYLASRSHPKYLAKLLEISKRNSLCNIVSITGGLAFLHALSDKTSSLVLIDYDPEVTAYGKAIIEVIIACKTRNEFFGLLTGKTLIVSDNNKVKFSPDPFQYRNVILNNLSPLARDCIERWYQPSNFDTTTSILKAEDKVVHFIDFSLSQQHFNWHCGWGCFSSEESYKNLNQSLTRLKPECLTMPLENYNFSACPADTLILASNTDSPLFTKNDAVLCSIKQSQNSDCYYVSRTRDYSIADSSESVQFGHAKLAFAPVGIDVPQELRVNISEKFPYDWRYITRDQYLHEQLYDLECVLFWLPSNEATGMSSAENHFLNELPIHQRISIISNSPINAAMFPGISQSYKQPIKFDLAETMHGKIEGLIFELKHRTAYLS
jgi:hypothetical protein